MSALADTSPVVAGIVALLTLLGAATALIGSIGLLRLRTFYERVHPPTMGTTCGVVLIVAATILLFSVLETRLVVHEILIGVFAVITTPVTYLMLVRAARARERVADEAAAGEGREEGSGDDESREDER
jgi:multicomponent K+:H+ antiporter subunit G